MTNAILRTSDGKLKMSGGDSLHLQVLGGVSCELQNLSSEVLEDRSAVDRGGGADSGVGADSGLEESVDVLNNVGINSQEASALIVVTQHYDTLQSIGEESNSNLILLPNSPQAGSDMLNNMVASFTASNMVGEAMKEQNLKKKNQGKGPTAS